MHKLKHIYFSISRDDNENEKNIVLLQPRVNVLTKMCKKAKENAAETVN